MVDLILISANRFVQINSHKVAVSTDQAIQMHMFFICCVQRMNERQVQALDHSSAKTLDVEKHQTAAPQMTTAASTLNASFLMQGGKPNDSFFVDSTRF